jgi:hypothetical protein
MDNSQFNGGNRGPSSRFGDSSATQSNGQGSSLRGPKSHFGGSSSAPSNGQGSSLVHGGFESMNQGFHPGYAGHRPYTGFGGGQYGGRERPGRRPLVHHPGFAAQRDQSGGKL